MATRAWDRYAKTLIMMWMAGASGTAMAQVAAPQANKPQMANTQGSEQAGEVSEIVVVGSYIDRRSADTPAPVLVVDRAELARSGANTTADVIRNLPVNTGSQFNTDERTQGGTTGTANINLRGLGIGSTLVLQDGRRRPLSLAATNDGVNFVDINSMMPFIMIERVEVLKDGAASLYGSDAVAGVVNFVTRAKFKGIEATGGYRSAASGGTRDLEAAGIFGVQNDRFGIVASLSYLDRTLLTEDEISLVGDTTTPLSNPGAFQPAFKVFTGPRVSLENRPTVVVGGPAVDPGCVRNGGTVTASNLCNFDTSRFATLVAAEKRFNAGVLAHWDVDDTTTLTFNANYARNDIVRVTTPSYPLSALPFVPSTNPGFVAGSAPPALLGTLAAVAAPPTATKGALFYGRALPMTGDPALNDFRYRTFWASTDVNGGLFGDWKYELAATYARETLYINAPDVLRDRFLAALAGQGGPNNNQFYNPFASSIGAAPSSPFFNDPAVVADFSSAITARSASDSWVFDAVANGTLFSIGGRDVKMAIGGHFRNDSRFTDANPEANANRLFFFRGRPDTASSRDVSAAFAEVSLPLAETVEVQTALRWEDHGGSIGSSVNPKIAAMWTPSSALTFRASYATAFRAPQPTQNDPNSSLTALERTVDPAVPLSSPFARATFYPVVRVGNPSLRPETSESYNVGATVRPVDGMFIKIDHWRFKIDDLIVGQSAQNIVNANNPAQVVRVSGTGTINFVQGTYVNAAQLRTNGIDIQASYRFDTGATGRLTADLNATYILDYKLREAAGQPLVERAGRRNFGTVATATPEWRTNFSLNWTNGRHSLTGIVRYIDAYLNDEPLTRSPVAPGQKIKSWTTLDAQYVLSLDGLLGGASNTALSVGVVNLLNTDPPFAATENGLPYDTRVADPRGRQVYISLKQAF